jgi:hypothetical protein
MLSEDISEVAAILQSYASAGSDFKPDCLEYIADRLNALALEVDQLQAKTEGSDIPAEVIKLAQILNRQGVSVGFTPDQEGGN